MKNEMSLCPALEIPVDNRNFFEMRLKWIFIILHSVAVIARWNAVCSGRTPSSSNRIEMFKKSILSAAIGTAPVEIVERFEPFFDRKSGNTSALLGFPPFVSNALRFFSVQFVCATLWAKIAYCGIKKRIVTYSANPVVSLPYHLGTSRMVIPNPDVRHVVKSKLNHAFHHSHFSTAPTLLLFLKFSIFGKMEKVFNNPLTRINILTHVSSKKKSPFALRASATQRGKFDCIRELLASPSKTVKLNYTTLEQAC